MSDVANFDVNNGGDGVGCCGMFKKAKYLSTVSTNEAGEECSALDTADDDQVVIGEEEVAAPENEQPTVLFVYQYHIVKHMIEYLPIKDVLQAGIVNKQWSDISRIVRKQRKNFPYTILIHPYLPHHKLAFEYFNGFQVSDEAKDLVQSGKDGYHPYKQKSYPRQIFTGLLTNAKEVIRSTLRNAYDEPQLIVNFGTSSFDGHIVNEYESHHKSTSKERLKILLGGIQDSIPCLTSFSCGVIANAAEFNNKALEMEKSKFPCLSSLAIPKVEGLKIQLFTITKSQNRSLKGNANTKKCRELLGINDINENQLKGIMLLHKVTHRTSSTVEMILEYLRSNPHVALAGGVHESVLVSGVADDVIIAAGMLIFGNELVRVTSVALQESKISENNRRKLEELKSSVQPGETSMAFMFACNGRGRHMHDRPNVESDLFNSLFPNTPMVGAFTLGEFCNDTMSLLGQDKDQDIISLPKNIDFAYTTVFLLISYKHPTTGGDASATGGNASATGGDASAKGGNEN